MSQAKKYKLHTVLTLVLVLIILSSEVVDRWSELSSAYNEMLTQKRELRSPEELASRKLELLARKRLLISAATKGQTSFEQTQTGVIEYLNKCAFTAGTKYLSLSPVSSKTKGEMTEISFKISLRDDFHSLGRWLNLIETGSIACTIRKLHFRLEQIRNPKLQVEIEAVAFIFPKAGP